MTETLDNLIEALREELQQYGEMLARFDDQQAHLRHNRTDATLAGVTSLHDQGLIIQYARRRREQVQSQLASRLHLPDHGNLTEMVTRLPRNYQPLVEALADECASLARVVEQRAREHDRLQREPCEHFPWNRKCWN